VTAARGLEQPRRRTSDALALVGLEGVGKKRVSKLLDEEVQHVAIARAIVRRPTLFLADEPLGALDEATEGKILDLLASLQEDGTSFVIASHSPRVAAACRRRITVAGRRLRKLANGR
jgi:putative ABC transport system ATP-binding protein